MKNHAKMLSAVTLASVPKLTVVVGGSYGINNYLMVREDNWGTTSSGGLVKLWFDSKE